MICDICQGKVVASPKEGWFVCEYCDTEYPLEWMKAKFQKMQTINVDGPVELDTTTRVKNLLVRALEFYKNNDEKRSLQYCERVLDIDAANEKAKALQARILELKVAEHNIMPNSVLIFLLIMLGMLLLVVYGVIAALVSQWLLDFLSTEAAVVISISLCIAMIALTLYYMGRRIIKKRPAFIAQRNKIKQQITEIEQQIIKPSD